MHSYISIDGREVLTKCFYLIKALGDIRPNCNNKICSAVGTKVTAHTVVTGSCRASRSRLQVGLLSNHNCLFVFPIPEPNSTILEWRIERYIDKVCVQI